MIKPYLELGKVVGTHGVRGELRVNPWCDTPDFARRFKTLYWDKMLYFVLTNVFHRRILRYINQYLNR